MLDRHANLRGAALVPFVCALILATSTLVPSRADACGGFFCSFNAQVNQAAERILFAVEGTTATAHIQINYQGDAVDFSWVLPLPSVPEVGVGTDLLFTSLHQLTDPRFMVEWEKNDDCKGGFDCAMPMAASSDMDGGGLESPEDKNAVDVLAEGEVGPFEFKVVASEDAAAMFDWLNENDYDQPEAARPLIEHYVEINHVFLALKLLKDKEAGEIRPVVITYEAPALACIPIRLTSIAANADMPVYTWVLAGARAVPLNFFHVQLNPRKYPWLECGSRTGDFYWYGWFNSDVDCSTAYLDLVSEAADSAAGRGFVTEFAGASDIMKDMIFTEGRWDTSALREISSPGAFLQALLSQGFPRNAISQGLIRRFIPQPDVETLPEGCKTEQEFYTRNLEECMQHMPEDWTFDPIAFADAIDEELIKPLTEAQALFGKHPYLTRMFTTMSPDEMTRDPIFSFNPELPDVSNEHTVKARFECKEGTTDEPESITITYPDDSTESVAIDESQTNQCGPIVLQGGDRSAEPAASAVQVLGEEGAAETVTGEDVANQDEAFDRIPMPTVDRAGVTQNPDANENPDKTGTFGTPTTGSGDGTGTSGTGDGTEPTPTDGDDDSGGGGCQAGHGHAPWNALALLAGIGLVAVRRRRTT